LFSNIGSLPDYIGLFKTIVKEQQGSNEVVNAEYTLFGEVFFMDEKQQRPGMGSQRAPSKVVRRVWPPDAADLNLRYVM